MIGRVDSALCSPTEWQMAVCLREIMLLQMPEPRALLLIALTSSQQSRADRQEAAPVSHGHDSVGGDSL